MSRPRSGVKMYSCAIIIKSTNSAFSLFLIYSMSMFLFILAVEYITITCKLREHRYANILTEVGDEFTLEVPIGITV